MSWINVVNRLFSIPFEIESIVIVSSVIATGKPRNLKNLKDYYTALLKGRNAKLLLRFLRIKKISKSLLYI